MDLLLRPEPLAWLQGALGPGWIEVAEAVGVLGSAWAVTVAAGLALWLGGRGVLLALLALAAVEAVVRQALARAFDVPRPSHPTVSTLVEMPSSPSFPSGHVSTTAALFGFLAVATGFPAWLAVLLVAASAVARVYLGVHWVADVVGAAVLGAALAWAWRPTWPRVRSLAVGRERAVETALAGLALAAAAAAFAFWVGDEVMSWNAAALVAALAVAVPLQRRWAPVEPAAGRAGALCAVGLSGLVPFVVAERTLGGADALAIGAALVAAGTVWALLGAPWIVDRRRTTGR